MPRSTATVFRTLAWLAFWMLIGGFYTAYFGRESGNYRGSLLLVSFLLPVAAAASHVLADLLVPRLLLRGRRMLFALYAIYVLIAATYLEFFALVTIFVFGVDYRIADMNPEALDFMGLLVGLNIVVFLVVAIRLTQQWYALRDRHREAERARLAAELKLREVELAQLRGQIHPHFLFNSLNNLYGLTLAKANEAPDAVLRLSGMLDYLLYKAGEGQTPLAEELRFIEAYLALEKLRFGDRLSVEADFPDPIPDRAVAPLLLLPLVENAVKHGVRPSVAPSKILVRIHARGDRIICEVENTLPDDPPPDAGQGGIGLENLRRRLEILYPDRHSLQLDQLAASFVARLEWTGDPAHD